MKKGLVLTVGNDLMGDDAAGPLLGRMIRQSPLRDWEVLDGGSAPENYVYKIRELAPDEVMIVDAAEMGGEPGEIRLIGDGTIGSLWPVSTHSLPLTYLMEALREFVPSVRLIGIQPTVVAFGSPVSASMKCAVKRVYRLLEGNTLSDCSMPSQVAPIVGVERGADGQSLDRPGAVRPAAEEQVL